ncbi:MAG: hypothetical protein CMA07_06720 [Euryarchaeota archaeon]|nr:hypothetical protein [Euryarchaeota archaeon]|tara:strand:- start:4949 stop:5707 length:759 start_codon:yes stop_codon:yes gene_type:complete
MNISDIKKMKEAYLEVVSETQKEDIDPELLKKAAVGKKKADDEEENGKKAVPAGKDVDVEKDDESGDDKEDKVIPPKKKKKDDEEEVEEDNTNDKSDDGEGLDKVQPKATKKKFKDRKDKDIDNDGDVDDSDKFLHKRRKAVSKAMAKEGFEHATEDLLNAIENIFEKKADGEEHGETQSKKEKEFADQHKGKSDKKVEDNVEDAKDKVTAAGRGGPSPKKRPGDNPQGDKAPVKVKEESELIQKTLEQLRK